MTQTVFITGSSSGISTATATHFHAQGWTVVAATIDRTATDGTDRPRSEVGPDATLLGVLNVQLRLVGGRPAMALSEIPLARWDGRS